MFDISTSCENTLQVHPTTLDIDPHVKKRHDAIKLVLPAQGIFLKHLRKKKQMVFIQLMEFYLRFFKKKLQKIIPVTL